MKNKKLTFYHYMILVSFVFLGFFLGADVALMIRPLIDSTPMSPTFSILFFLAGLLSMVMVFLLAYLFNKRKSLLFAQASTKEYFQNEHFVYTEGALMNEIERKRRRHKNNGVVAVLGVKDINSEILSLYGASTVKEVNETIFRCIYEKWVNKKEYAYAYNILDDFIIYKITDDESSFYMELSSLSKEITAQLRKNPNLPSLKILLGAYHIQDSDTVEQAIRRAAYAEKFNAATRLNDEVVVFAPEMVGQSENQRDLSYDLTRGLEEGQFEIFYQPKFDLKTSRFFGAEALIRWNHPLRGLMPPSVFIPFAEQSGRIVDIDRYVFRHVCMDIQRWEKEGKRLLKISVNLSRRSCYDPSVLSFFDATMKEYGVNPLILDIELTESVAAKDAIFTASMIKRLKEMKLSTSIDDFGVGYSSFSALKKIPFDTLKIDKSFIDDIEIDKKARDMVQCVIQLGHSLEMKVIAEGVQSEKQVQILKDFGLDSIQGYFYSKPLECFEYEKFLASNRFEKGKKA